MRNKAIAVLIIVAGVFSAFAFLVPFPREETFWIAYIAELLAIALQIPIFKVAFDGANDLRSRVLGYPIARVGYIYLGIQTVASLALFALGFIPIPSWLSILICIIIFGAALACSISASAARDEVEKIEAAVKPDTELMMNLRTRSAQLVNNVSDPALKKQLETFAEDVRFSDPVSSPAIAGEDQRLVDVISQLENAVNSDSDQTAQLIVSAQAALNDRNTACMNNKAR